MFAELHNQSPLLTMVHTAPEEFLKHNNDRSVWIGVWGKLGQCDVIISEKLRFQKGHKNDKLHGIFKFRFEKCFGKALFPWRIIVDNRPNRCCVLQFLRGNEDAALAALRLVSASA